MRNKHVLPSTMLETSAQGAILKIFHTILSPNHSTVTVYQLTYYVRRLPSTKLDTSAKGAILKVFPFPGLQNLASSVKTEDVQVIYMYTY